MLRDFADERELRIALYDLTSRVAHTDTVLLLVGEYTPEEWRSGIEFSLADGIIQLDYQAREPVDRRSLRVTKVRGVESAARQAYLPDRPWRHRGLPAHRNPHPGQVRRRPAGLAHRNPRPGRADGRRDEGHRRHPRHGTLRRRQDHLRAALDRPGLEQGQQCLYVTFQDTPRQLTAMAASFGWDLEAARAAGRLAISYVPMGDLDLDVLANAVRAELAEHTVSRVVHRQPGRTGFRRPRIGTFPRFHAQPARAHPRGRQLIAASPARLRAADMPPGR